MTLAICAFFCKISDPRFGGTYMTLFNTFYYLGFLMSNTLVLKLMAVLTFSECSNRCHTKDFKNVSNSFYVKFIKYKCNGFQPGVREW